MPAEITRHHPFNHSALILIEPTVIYTIEPYRQDSNRKLEAGGILLGYRRGQHIHVTEATTPFPLDIRHRYEFHRRDPKHQHFALEKWRESNGTLDYLGEWHTHPESHPIPSSIDSSEWKKLCKINPSPLVFIIAGEEANDWIGLGWQDMTPKRTLITAPTE